MSDECWVKTLVRGLLVLNLSYIYGLCHDSSVCLVYQDKIGNLNCSWKSDVWSRNSVSLYLQDLTTHDEPPLLLNVILGQTWLVIPRENLTMFHWYNITIIGGGKKDTENFFYSHEGDNIFIRPPLLNSSILENETLEISWKHPDGEEWDHLLVTLRYRVLGAHNWTKVDSNDLEINTYVMDNPVPNTKYEFQIRYLPDEKNRKKGSLWSESHVLTSYEMAPNGSSDVWRSLQNGSFLLVMWKPLDHRSARGEISSYLVTYVEYVEYTIPKASCCSEILPAQSTQVCVRARNSKGLGPPACVTPLCTEMINSSVFDCEVRGNSTGRINVLCQEHLKSEEVLSYILEWREDEKTKINWMRSRTVSKMLALSGDLTPGVLYYISVYVLYNNSCTRTFSTESYSQEEVPTAAPNFTSHVLSAGNVLVSWEEIPRRSRGGIISHYTIYLKSTDRFDNYTVSNGSGNETLSRLSSGTAYTIWMTASTRAGEGQRSPHKTFQTGNRHRVLLIVAVVISVLLVCGAVLCFSDCKISFWPKIPKPEGTFKELFKASSGNMWQPQQVSLNPVIAVVEEIEPPPQPPTPSPPSTPLLNKTAFITSGYEKHFMPTIEEVMGLG